MNLARLCLGLCALATPFGVAVAAAPVPSIEERTEQLLAQMTLDEKVGQLNQASYNGPAEQLAQIRTWAGAGKLGSVLNALGAREFNELQALAVTQTRLKIPLLNGVDVIHGYRTQFPIPLGQSTSWHPERIEQAARVAAIEARAAGINWTFAPMIDIARDPRWGRIAESLGEDPYLTSVLGAAMVRGFQGPSLTDPTSLLACAKHFAGYGAAEAGRDYNTTLIPETELRNVYLRPFHAAVEAGALTFMAAFNDLNGTPASANPFLHRTVLKGEWAYRGFVVSDWDSVKELQVHGVAGSPRDAARLALNAGVDMEMVSRSYAEHAAELVQAGEVTPANLDDAVRRILRVKFAAGLFERPFADEGNEPVWLAAEHRRLARELAAESLVLLKNERQTLPLSPAAKRVGLIGPLADSALDMLGTWHCQGRPEDVVTVKTGLRQTLPANVELVMIPALKNTVDGDPSGFADAVAQAATCDVIIACVGESEAMSGEARSRAFLHLPGAQGALLEALRRAGKPLVAVVFAGRPLVLTDVVPHVDALLYAWHPGTEAGPAVAEILSGQRTPSGKLTTTFPRTVGQAPLYYNHRMTGRPPGNEELGAPMGTPQDPRGYTSKHLDVHSSPAFPFGFGLSYTTFAYRDLKVSAPDAKGQRTVEVTVQNTGLRDGVEIVQLYTRDPVASLTRPVRELKAFRRVAIAAGASTRVDLALPAEALGFYDATGRFVIEQGRFEVYVGGDSTAEMSVAFEQK